VAIGLLHVAERRADAELLALSDLWARRAVRDSRRSDGFHNAKIQITPDVVGHASPFHAMSGVHAAAALVAVAQADQLSQAEAIDSFVASTSEGAVGLDVTVGLGSIALGAALILDAIGPNPYVDTGPLRARGEQAIASMWRELDALPPIADAGIEYLGIAHGWAGFLYVSLLWSDSSGSGLPAGIERRLQELGRLAMPTGRGVEWPWLLQRGSQMTMPGWCNGTSGQVFLWNLAHRCLARDDYAALAERCAWHAWESTESGPSICCGLSGRAYSLLNHFRHTGERDWLQRAERLAHRAATERDPGAEFAHSLYKGEFGLAVLLADLDCPEQSAMPFFEPAPRAGTQSLVG
jgi:serine/threonine-protein kinase